MTLGGLGENSNIAIRPKHGPKITQCDSGD